MLNPVNVMPETWGSLGSALLTFIVFWETFRRYCPPGLSTYLHRCINTLSVLMNPYVEISISEYLGRHFRLHEAYRIVEAYLSTKSLQEAMKLKAEMATDGNDKLMLSMGDDQKITDDFHGVRVQWISEKVSPPQQQMLTNREPDRRCYKLKFHKRHREMIETSYLEHVIKSGKENQTANRQRKLYTNEHSTASWRDIPFEHPATFDTLAMDPKKKEEIMEDLLAFTTSKDFYKRIGKAWKRGYLLHGPPGTGKSTMIAAMANLLNYDIYDLELTAVKDNGELRKLLMRTTAKSIIVIEDIDCSLDLTGQRKKEKEKSADEETEKGKKRTREEKEDGGSKVTLSGLLNSIDGLWSACAGERLIVFTTNFAHKLDPALTRRGRMDKHIELSYCQYEGFKVLAKNYLQVEAHRLFQSVEELIKEVEITPADVAEIFMPKYAKPSPEQSLLDLICALEEAKGRKNVKCSEEHEDKETNNNAIAAPKENHEM